MTMKKALIPLCFFATNAYAIDDYSISVYAGQNFNQSLETKESIEVELKDSHHLALSIDRNIDKARYGFFYSKSKNDFSTEADKHVTMQYLLFQSAVEVPISNHFNGYVGAQLGANYVQTNFSANDVFFASGLFGGVEYLFSDQVRILFETRWLATIVNNDSVIDCTLPATKNEQCLWHFDGDVLNQFQTSLGFTFRF